MSTKLPPTERDFDIYEAVHVAGYPTREQAEKYGISQTRVRQIVRRVIEWLGEVIPPQAKIAKEQVSHLARQIAADRFNLQYTEASTNWYQSGELKFAGLRIRITHAQARLGVPGSLIGGLAADAIEGIDVPAYQPPHESNDGVARAPTLKRRSRAANQGAAGRGSPDPDHDSTEGLPDEDQEPAPSSMSLDLAKFIYQFRHILIPPPHRPNELEEAKQVLLAAGYQLPDDDQTHRKESDATHPPVRDCSTSSAAAVDEPTARAPHANETESGAKTCDENEIDHCVAETTTTTTSQLLLTGTHPLPVIELQVTPKEPGATVSTIEIQAEPPSAPAPCLPSPLT